MQKTDKQGKNVMWCFVEFEEVVQAARCMKVLQVSHFLIVPPCDLSVSTHRLATVCPACCITLPSAECIPWPLLGIRRMTVIRVSMSLL